MVSHGLNFRANERYACFHAFKHMIVLSHFTIGCDQSSSAVFVGLFGHKQGFQQKNRYTMRSCGINALPMAGIVFVAGVKINFFAMPREIIRLSHIFFTFSCLGRFGLLKYTYKSDAMQLFHFCLRHCSA